MNFNASSGNILMGYFGRKYVMFELKKYWGVVSWKMTYDFKNGIRNLVNFPTSSWTNFR